MTKEQVKQKVTCNGMREMTEERFNQCMDEYAFQAIIWLHRLPFEETAGKTEQELFTEFKNKH